MKDAKFFVVWRTIFGQVSHEAVGFFVLLQLDKKAQVLVSK
jgi:hypothetical protein